MGLTCLLLLLCIVTLGIRIFDIDKKIGQDTNRVPAENKVTLDTVQEKDIAQWALCNTGLRPESISRNVGWGQDVPKAQEDFDIQYQDYSEHMLRLCTIAVIDSAFDIQHPALKSIWINSDEIQSDKIENDRNGYVDDCNGWDFYNNDNTTQSENQVENIHGTHMIGILCGATDNFTGVLQGSQNQVMCLRALGGIGDQGKIETVVEAIRYAEANAAQICCLSLSTYVDSPQLAMAIAESKMLFVVAGGNDGIELTREQTVFPASYQLETMISVADVRSDGNLSATSNYSTTFVDVAAPGTDIVSTCPGGKFAYSSGTSCAVPFVGGLAGMLYSCSPKPISAAEIKDTICRNITPSPNLKRKVRTGGMIDFYASFEDLQVLFHP
jgi:subtilisin family serine protease